MEHPLSKLKDLPNGEEIRNILHGFKITGVILLPEPRDPTRRKILLDNIQTIIKFFSNDHYICTEFSSYKYIIDPRNVWKIIDENNEEHTFDPFQVDFEKTIAYEAYTFDDMPVVVLIAEGRILMACRDVGVEFSNLSEF